MSNTQRTAFTAVLWMLGALGSFTAMAVAAREVSTELNTFQLLFFRTSIALAVLLILVWPRYGNRVWRTQQPGAHGWRHLAHFAGQFGWFYGIAHIPLAEVFALEFTVPVWAALWATLLLGERMNRYRWMAVTLGLSGVLLILRPGVAIIDPAAMAVLAGAAAYGISHTLTRRLTLTDQPLTILFYMNLVQWPLSAWVIFFDWQMPSAQMWPCLIAIGLTALTAHYCMSRALALAEATVVIPIDFLRLPLVMALGWFLYGEALDVFVLFGAGLMFTGIFVNVLHEVRRVRASA